MTTLYLDYEGGNDNYGGTSFAPLASGTDGRIGGTGSATFSSVSASFPNDGSLINQYLSIFNGSSYVTYRVSAWVSSTSLTIAQISGGAALSNITTNQQYYIGGRWKTITSGATSARTVPGDTIRVMASTDPTSVGSATWTGGGRPLTSGISSSTNATPIVISSTGHGLVTGDYVSITGHTTNTNANGVWKVGATTSSTFAILQMDGTNTTGNGVGATSGNATKVNNCIVKLASPVTKNIALCGGLGQKPAWTASANVTVAQVTSAYKEGYACTQVSPATAFTTGKAAYYTLPSTLDLSAYQQVSFWVQQNGGLGVAGQAYVALCTDTTGDVVAHQCDIPSLGSAGVWVPVTVNLGTNLNSAIRSVALYVATDSGIQQFWLDDIIACKASSSTDSLNLTSLISKSDGTGDEAWYAIQSINYDAVMLANDNSVLSTSTSIRGYNGTSETVTTYKRETIKTAAVASSTASVQNINESGTSGNLIAYSGGWNRTDMSTQTGHTWFDGQNGLGYGINAVANFIDYYRLDMCRYTIGILINGTNNQLGSYYSTACGTNGLQLTTANNSTATNIWCNNNATGISIGGAGITIGTVKTVENCGIGVNMGAAPANGSFGSIISGNCGSGNINLGGVGNVINSYTCTNSKGFSGITGGGTNNYINGGSTTGNSIGIQPNSMNGSLFLNNFTVNEVTEFQIAGLALGSSFVYSNRHDNTDGNNWIWQGAGTINQQTSVVDSPATTSWKMNPTNANASATVPLKLKLGTVVCAANSLVTVTARMRRDNTGLTMRLCCPGGQIVGVSSDVTSDMTAAANTWETVTITFTPTKAGGVDIYAYAFGGTTYSGYVCNLTASQA